MNLACKVIYIKFNEVTCRTSTGLKTMKQKTWSKEELLDFQERWRGVTIPVNIKLDVQQTALHLEQVLDIIRESEQIAVTDCVCRAELQNCNYPLDVCLTIDSDAKRLVAEGEAEFITKAEAKKVLIATHELGLVHLALHRPSEDESHIQAICSCCSCCCHALQGLLLMDMKELIKPSTYISTHNPEECINCGDCVQRCHFNARVLNEEDIMIFNPNDCFGCGLCVSSCSQNAIEMIERSIV